MEIEQRKPKKRYKGEYDNPEQRRIEYYHPSKEINKIAIHPYHKKEDYFFLVLNFLEPFLIAIISFFVIKYGLSVLNDTSSNYRPYWDFLSLFIKHDEFGRGFVGFVLSCILIGGGSFCLLYAMVYAIDGESRYNWLKGNYSEFKEKAKNREVIDTEEIPEEIVGSIPEPYDDWMRRLNKLKSLKQQQHRLGNPHGSDCMLHDDDEARKDAKLNERGGLNLIGWGYVLGFEHEQSKLPLRMDFEGHAMIMAPTGMGKTVHLQTVLTDYMLHPKLQPWYSSCFIYDPGAVLWKKTGWFQYHVKHNKKYLLNASGTDGDFTNHFNPLDLLDPSKPKQFDKWAKRYAARLAPKESDYEESYWKDNGQQLILMLLLHLCLDFPKEERTLSKLLELCSGINHDYYIEKDLVNHPKSNLLKTIARYFRDTAENAPRTYAGFASTARQKLGSFNEKAC